MAAEPIPVRWGPWALLGLAAAVGVAAQAAIPHDGFPLLAQLAALLPLQLAALLVVLARPRTRPFKGAESPAPAWRPPASG